jgi:hypothetical protein
VAENEGAARRACFRCERSARSDAPIGPSLQIFGDPKNKNNLKYLIWNDLLIGGSFSYKNNVIMTKCVEIPSNVCLKFIGHSFKRRFEVSPLLFHSFIIHYFIIR